ncbi:MAG: ornithine cyclodeaminase [Chloroflexi bacterium]|nr:MAG: ornithine cyclodeaminase [Chloroflexota bacterium]
MKIRVLGAEAIARACPMPDAIDVVEEGFKALSSGRARVPLRLALPLREPESSILFMPAALEGGEAATVKVVSVVPGNGARGLPIVQGAVLLVDATTGTPRALLDGTALTALRTGAAGGVAARRLARTDARVVAVYGAGAQARAQLQALVALRRFREIRIAARHREHAAAFAAEFSRPGVKVVVSGREAARGADIVACATTSSEPVFDAGDLAPGAHVTGVGSYRPDMREIPPEALAGAFVVVDQRDAALAEAGELIAAVAAGLLKKEDIVEIGDDRARRTSPQQRTVFKSVGNAVQDLVVATRVLERAEALGLGSLVDL